jgi:uncharacterized protein (TIGR00369 family)
MKSYPDHLTPLQHTAQNRCFGCGSSNPHGLQLKFLIAEDGTIVCETDVSADFCGHPGCLHGGIIATLLDEAMSKAVRASGVASMTRRLEVEYLKIVPSNAPIRIVGRVVRIEGRKRWAEARILDAEGIALAHAKGLFVEVRPRETPS